jgi:hypothetical protein
MSSLYVYKYMHKQHPVGCSYILGLEKSFFRTSKSPFKLLYKYWGRNRMAFFGRHCSRSKIILDIQDFDTFSHVKTNEVKISNHSNHIQYIDSAAYVADFCGFYIYRYRKRRNQKRFG